MNSKELAAKAADEIERRGWFKGDLAEDYENLDNCAVCVLGATGAVYYGTPIAGYNSLDREYLTALDAIANGLGVLPIDEDYDPVAPVTRMWTWNDREATHAKDPQQYVVRELRRYANSGQEVAA